MKAKVTPEGTFSLPAELREKHGLTDGGEVIVEDAGDAIVLRSLEQAVAQAQSLSRKALAHTPSASVDDFLAGRAGMTDAE